jgi:hypothetical protein
VSFQLTGALSERNAVVGRPPGSRHKPWRGMSAALLQLVVMVQLFPAFAVVTPPLQ